MSMIEKEMKIDLNLDELLKAAGGAGNHRMRFRPLFMKKYGS